MQNALKLQDKERYRTVRECILFGILVDVVFINLKKLVWVYVSSITLLSWLLSNMVPYFMKTEDKDWEDTKMLIKGPGDHMA